MPCAVLCNYYRSRINVNVAIIVIMLGAYSVDLMRYCCACAFCSGLSRVQQSTRSTSCKDVAGQPDEVCISLSPDFFCLTQTMPDAEADVKEERRATLQTVNKRLLAQIEEQVCTKDACDI